MQFSYGSLVRFLKVLFKNLIRYLSYGSRVRFFKVFKFQDILSPTEVCYMFLCIDTKILQVDV